MHEEQEIDGSVSVSSVSLDRGRDEPWSADAAHLAQLMSDRVWTITEGGEPNALAEDAPSEGEPSTEPDAGPSTPSQSEGVASDGGPELSSIDAIRAEAERLKQSIIEQARAQAHYEAERIRGRALKEAQEAKAASQEEIRAEAQREATWLREHAAAEAETLKSSIIEQARAQAQYEASQLREQALSEADEVRRQAGIETEQFKIAQLDNIRVEVEAEAARLRQDADALIHEEWLSLRADALAEAEQVKQAIIEHARTKASADAARLIEEAQAEADRLRTEASENARREAERIRLEAAAEAEEIRAESAQALAADYDRFDAETLPDGDDTEGDPLRGRLLSSSEIGHREFPIATRGFDRESVRKWLRLVELSHGILEEELDRARAEWERSLEVLATTRIYLGRLPRAEGYSVELPLDCELDRARAEWERSVENLTACRPKSSESSFRALLLQKAKVEDLVGHQLFGYDKAQVRELLDSSASHVARLENQVANLRAENDELRSRMLHQVLEATPHFITVPGQQGAPSGVRGLLGPSGVPVDLRATEVPSAGSTGDPVASNGHKPLDRPYSDGTWSHFPIPNGAVGGPDSPDVSD